MLKKFVSSQPLRKRRNDHDCHAEIIRAAPGLWLAVESLLAENLAHVLEVAQQGVQTAEHAAFVRSLSPDAPPVSS